MAKLPEFVRRVDGTIQSRALTAKQRGVLRSTAAIIKLRRHRGVSAPGNVGASALLFTGYDAAAKMTAARTLATDLGLHLLRVDLASVVSKYIGETEKNLDRVFAEADGSTVLLLDEADAIFGKRSEVKDSHDRYANIEVAYLLRKIEEFDGIVILATRNADVGKTGLVKVWDTTLHFPSPE